MSGQPPGRSYGAVVSATAIGIAFLSAVALYVVFGGSAPGQLDRDRVFGDPFPSAAASPVPSLLDPVRAAGRATQPAAALPAAPAASAAPPTPLAAVAPGAGPARPSARAAAGADPLERARGLAGARDWAGAIGVYDRLVARRPSDRDLAVERARVVAWSGDNRGGAAALGAVLDDRAADAALRVEQAQFFWWAGEVAAADSVLGIALATAPGLPAADSLRATVRRATPPSLALAQRWLHDDSSPRAHLQLARAYARERRLVDAVPHYHAALSDGVASDSVALEAASVATAVGNHAAAATALEWYLQRHPDDRSARLRLARAHAWAGDAGTARPHYDALLVSADDAALRLEAAQVEAWSGNRARAEGLLRGAAPPLPAAAEKLLGDLALWRGDAGEAVQRYRAAASLDPSVPGLGDGTREAERLLAAATPAAPRVATWTGTVEGFRDSDGFGWLASSAHRRWGGAGRGFALAAQQEAWGGSAASGEIAGTDYGVEITGEVPLTRRLGARLALGARSLDGGAEVATWGAEVTTAGRGSTLLALRYSRQPALRRAGTAAARESETISNLAGLTVSRQIGAWNLWSQVEGERFTSELGDVDRASGALAVRRELGAGWAGFVSVGALAADGASPVLPGAGPLLWAPSSYVAPAAGIAFRAPVGDGWHLGGRVAPGYAWVRERADAARRFDGSAIPLLQAGAEASWARGPWRVDASGDWSTPFGEGYRAGALRLSASYAPAGRP